MSSPNRKVAQSTEGLGPRYFVALISETKYHGAMPATAAPPGNAAGSAFASCTSLSRRARYLMLSAIVKMGRYMAMRKKPTTPPRKTISTGSIIAVSAPTAASTSSS